MKYACVGTGVLFIVGLAAVLSGCGGKAGAEAVAQSFVSAMGKGDMTTAADYWDYITYCKQQNSDWDTFSKTQQDLVIKESKFQEKRATELEYWKTYFSRTSKVATVTEQGDSATAALEGSRASELVLVKHGEKWYITDMR